MAMTRGERLQQLPQDVRCLALWQGALVRQVARQVGHTQLAGVGGGSGGARKEGQ